MAKINGFFRITMLISALTFAMLLIIAMTLIFSAADPISVHILSSIKEAVSFFIVYSFLTLACSITVLLFNKSF